MEQGSIGDKILCGLLIWFLLGQWLLFIIFALPFVGPAVVVVIVIGVFRGLLKG